MSTFTVREVVAILFVAALVYHAAGLGAKAAEDKQPGSERHASPVRSVTFSSDGKTITARTGNEVLVWDAATGKKRSAARQKNAGNAPIDAFSADGKLLAHIDGARVRVSEADTGKELARLEADKELIIGLAFAPDGKTLAVGSANDVVRLWDVAAGKAVRSLKTLTPEVLAFSSDSSVLISTSWREVQSTDRIKIVRAVRLWDVATGQPLASVPQEESCTAVALSPDNHWLACATYGEQLYLWEVAAGRKVFHAKGHAGRVSCLAFSPDGLTLATGADDGTVKTWSLLTCARMALQRDTGNEGPKGIEECWDALSKEDSLRAFMADCWLRENLSKAIPWMARNLPPLLGPKRIRQLVADLDDDAFDVRDQATKDLAKLGKLAEKELRRALANKPSLEMQRRIETLLEQLTDGRSEELRWLRAITALERMGTPEARHVLQTVAGLNTVEELTKAAKTALERLDKRRSPR